MMMMMSIGFWNALAFNKTIEWCNLDQTFYKKDIYITNRWIMSTTTLLFRINTNALKSIYFTSLQLSRFHDTHRTYIVSVREIKNMLNDCRYISHVYSQTLHLWCSNCVNRIRIQRSLCCDQDLQNDRHKQYKHAPYYHMSSFCYTRAMSFIFSRPKYYHSKA